MVKTLLDGSNYSNSRISSSDGKDKDKKKKSCSQKKRRGSRRMIRDSSKSNHKSRCKSKRRKSKRKSRRCKSKCYYMHIPFRYDKFRILSAKRKCKSRLGNDSCLSDPNCDWNDFKGCNGKADLSLTGVYSGPSLPVGLIGRRRIKKTFRSQ
jgi:hypothetical protein